ncbi:hypothetical protein Fmac_008974 [Flemingia macrophylla]|uniref:Uncharacterized protein n=1 Tax=Flemingia macrophylla TaxID=520843 RepID=A0ABD1MYZ0_9FABA
MVVEEEANLGVGLEGFEFVSWFNKCLKWFRIYFEALDKSFLQMSNERLMLERVERRAVVNLMAGATAELVEWRERAAQWTWRMRNNAFVFTIVCEVIPFSHELGFPTMVEATCKDTLMPISVKDHDISFNYLDCIHVVPPPIVVLEMEHEVVNVGPKVVMEVEPKEVLGFGVAEKIRVDAEPKVVFDIEVVEEVVARVEVERLVGIKVVVTAIPESLENSRLMIIHNDDVESFMVVEQCLWKVHRYSMAIALETRVRLSRVRHLELPKVHPLDLPLRFVVGHSSNVQSSTDQPTPTLQGPLNAQVQKNKWKQVDGGQRPRGQRCLQPPVMKICLTRSLTFAINMLALSTNNRGTKLAKTRVGEMEIRDEQAQGQLGRVVEVKKKQENEIRSLKNNLEELKKALNEKHTKR